MKAVMLQPRKRSSLPMTSTADLPFPVASSPARRSPSRESLNIELSRIYYVLKAKGRRQLYALGSSLSSLHANILSVSAEQYHPAIVALARVYFYLAMLLTLTFAFCETALTHLCNWLISLRSQNNQLKNAWNEKISEQLDSVLLKIQVLDAKVAVVINEQSKLTEVSFRLLKRG
jgi:hypothetical protein